MTMDMVRRAYTQIRAEQEKGTLALDYSNAFHREMVLRMVRWIKLRVYSKRDWPKEFGPYPAHLENEVER